MQPENPHYSSAVSLAGKNGLYMSLGDEKTVGLVKLGEGSYQLFVGLRLPENWASDNAALLRDPLALRQWLLRDALADWAQVHQDMVQHSDGDFRAWPLYALPPESLSWQTVPGVALLGDAAHLS